MNFTIYNTKTTPYAELRNGVLQIRGKSVPFNDAEIYATIMDRMRVYMNEPEDRTVIDFSLSAINARSKRSIIEAFGLFEQMSQKGLSLQVNWNYRSDDEDVCELGEICKDRFKLNMNLNEISTTLG